MLRVTIPERGKLAALLFVAVLQITAASILATEAPNRVRDVLFTYHTIITVTDPAARRLEAWIPLPRDDAFQTVSALSIDSSVHTRIVDQHHDDNRMLYLQATAPLPPSIPVTVHFRIHRIEQSADLAKAQRDLAEPMDAELASFLRPDALVPTGGKIAQVSATIGDRDASPYQQAQAIYQWVIANMKYDKSGGGWGRGDALYACGQHSSDGTRANREIQPFQPVRVLTRHKEAVLLLRFRWSRRFCRCRRTSRWRRRRSSSRRSAPRQSNLIA